MNIKIETVALKKLGGEKDMETKGKKGLMVVVALISVLVVGFGAGCVDENNSTASVCVVDDPNVDAYEAVKVSSNTIRIIGIEWDYFTSDNGNIYEAGYGRAFGQGLEEVSKNYTILEKTPIQYCRGFAPVTKELILSVEPKVSE